jgi:hypothetical protein
MYYDGVQWVGSPVAAPQSVPMPQPGSVWNSGGGEGLIDGLIGRAKEFAADEKNQGTAMAVAGGAAIADGVVGIGRRPGIGSAITSIIFGIVFALIGWNITGMFASAMDVAEKRANERETQVQIVEMSYDTDGYCQPNVSVEETIVSLPLPVKSQPCEFAVGETVGVYYAPGFPSSVRLSTASADEMKQSAAGMIDLFRWVFVGAGVLLAIGGVFQLLMKLGVIAGGSVLLVLGLRKRKTAQEAREREQESSVE